MSTHSSPVARGLATTLCALTLKSQVVLDDEWLRCEVLPSSLLPRGRPQPWSSYLTAPAWRRKQVMLGQEAALGYCSALGSPVFPFVLNRFQPSQVSGDSSLDTADIWL